MSNAIYQTSLKGLELRHSGKVRDIYDLDDQHLLIVTTDRLSAFDVIMAEPVPGKGEVLTRVSNFWFQRHADLIPNQLSGIDPATVIPDAGEARALGDRALVVRKLKPLPIEAIVRGYLIGSGWKDYQATGTVCGIELPKGLIQADRLADAIFTPSSKAPQGEHDQNIGYADVVGLIGAKLAEQVRSTSLEIYRRSAAFALERGIIIADTKFEFGLDEQGRLHLIDEVLTPDSSRFWPLAEYRPGISPPSYDKQFVRDYLESLDWNKCPPPPPLPEDIIRRTAEKYAEAERLLTAG